MSRDQILRDMLKKISEESGSKIREEDYFEEEIRYRRISEIKRDDDHIITGSSWTIENVIERRIDTSKIISRIKKNKIFSELISHLINNYELQDDQAKAILETYLTHVLKNGCDQKDISQFLEDVNGIPPSWHNYIKLRGLVVKTEVIVGKYHFRDPIKRDLEFREYNHSFRSALFEHPHSILEFDNNNVSGPDNQREIISLIEILKLFTASAISYDRYRMNSHSFNTRFFGGELFTTAFRPDKPVFHLKQEDAENLISFIDYMKPKIGEVIHQRTNTPLNIAFQRYNDSLTKHAGVEEKLTSAIMGLEALFLTGDQELSYQLRIKAAKLLGYLNERPEEVLSQLKKSYRCRSKFIHGSILREKDPDEVNQMLDSCRNYLRKVIVYWFYHNIKSEKEKTRFLNKIEKALINDEVSHKFQVQANEMISKLSGVF